MPGACEDVLFRDVVSVFSAGPQVPAGSPALAEEDFTIGAALPAPGAVVELAPITRSVFLARRADALSRVVRNVRALLEDRDTPSTAKAFAFRCLNELVSASVMYRGRIVGVIAREEYGLWMRALAGELEWVADRVPSVKTLAA